MNLSKTIWIGRISLAIVFIWFGTLKIIGLSPANELVQTLLESTLPFIPFSKFIIFLGIWEALIGLLFLFPKITKIAFYLFILQMITTFGPLLIIPETVWQQFLLVPNIVGQYILKNISLIALGLVIHTQYQQSKALKR